MSRTLLVIAPHADDETLGMGGTIAVRVAEGDRAVVAVMTGHGDDVHPLWPRSVWETVRGEAAAAMAVLGAELWFRELPAACLTDIAGYKINGAVDEVLRSVAPDELYLPFYHDLHRDHGLLAYAALVAARPYLKRARTLRRVAMYETVTETHLFPGTVAPPFVPNLWIDVSQHFDRKLEAWDCYRSQHQTGHAPRTGETLRAIAKVRGSHIGVAAAEAFMIVQQVE